MSTENKDLAAVLLGASVGSRARSWDQTQETKIQIATTLTVKFHQSKEEAARSTENANIYFEELKATTANVFKEEFPFLLESPETILGTRGTNIISDSPTTKVNPAG